MSDHTLNINGVVHHVSAPDAMPLLWVLRDLLSLTGTKYGCGVGQCLACTVHLDGTAIPACQLPVSAAAGKQIRTIEGLATADQLSALQQAWIDAQVPQCGYCQSGQLMAAAALLQTHAQPTDAQIDQAMGGNLCRCGTYNRIRAAIHAAARGT